MKPFFLPTVALLAIAVAGCGSSLTEGGKKVQYVTKQEAPDACELIDEVAVGEGISLKAVSIGDLKIRMRNETAEMGGNYLVIDTIEAQLQVAGNTSSTVYAGTGRAYRCP